MDLGYTGLGNAGSWFTGSLQTDYERACVLDGLEAAAGSAFDRRGVEDVLAMLGNPVFLS